MLERPFAMEPRGHVLSVSGTVDEFSVLRLRTAISERVARGDLVIDLSDVDVLPSVGVGVLARSTEEGRRAGRSITLVAAPDTIAQRVLQVCGLPYRHSPTDPGDLAVSPGGDEPRPPV